MATLYYGVHDECGFVGEPTSKLSAASALAQHKCENYPGPASQPAPGAPVSRSVVLPVGLAAPEPGDWVVSRAGLRELITQCTASRPVPGLPEVEHRLDCIQLPAHCAVPADIQTIAVDWWLPASIVIVPLPADAKPGDAAAIVADWQRSQPKPSPLDAIDTTQPARAQRGVPGRADQRGSKAGPTP